MNINLFIYCLLDLKGIGMVKASKILYSLNHIFNNRLINKNVLISSKISGLTIEEIEQIFNTENKIINEFQKARDAGVSFVNIFDKEYPIQLKDSLKNNCPLILSYLGNIELLKSTKVGFCGSRKASEKGLNVATDITQQVTEKQITVVSGYASGIDQQTHYWALKNGGNTIVVLPEGIKEFKIKNFVREVWNWEHVLVISEFGLNAIWSVHRAMQRNATIIGLSDIMILIEAREKGGSIDAGNKALQMNKILFAPIY